MTLYRVNSNSEAAFPPDWPVAPALALQHPNEVLEHPALADAEKRAILAHWASDAHAVENAPSLRQLESGARVPVSEVLQALRSLDDRAADADFRHKGKRRLIAAPGELRRVNARRA